jgi:hypothetical protein
MKKMVRMTYPDFGPWKDAPKNYLWIIIKVLKPPQQKAHGRGSVISAPAQGTEYKFLAPRAVNFAISHEWANYENVTSRLANVIANYSVPYQDLTTGATPFLTGIKDILAMKGLTPGGLTQGAKGRITENIIKLGNTEVINYRVDSAQVYKSSEFLTYIFEFDFGIHGDTRESSPQQMWEMTQDLMKFSSPADAREGTGTDKGIFIDPPHIFTIESWPSKFLYIQYASIRNIQLDISECLYIGGYPTNYKATITFTDIEPLFDSSFVDSPSSKVSTGKIKAQEVIEGAFTSLLPGRR